MKKVVVSLALSALLAPLALGQTHSSTAEKITVTGTVITATEDGAAASYQPAKTLVVRQDSSNKPGVYALNGPGHIWDKRGALVQTAIKPGTRVRVFYTSDGDTRVIDHVVLLD